MTNRSCCDCGNSVDENLGYYQYLFGNSRHESSSSGNIQTSWSSYSISETPHNYYVCKSCAQEALKKDEASIAPKVTLKATFVVLAISIFCLFNSSTEYPEKLMIISGTIISALLLAKISINKRIDESRSLDWANIIAGNHAHKEAQENGFKRAFSSSEVDKLKRESGKIKYL